jgi:hypothetical protein
MKIEIAGESSVDELNGPELNVAWATNPQQGLLKRSREDSRQCLMLPFLVFVLEFLNS